MKVELRGRVDIGERLICVGGGLNVGSGPPVPLTVDRFEGRCQTRTRTHVGDPQVVLTLRSKVRLYYERRK
jgi:hypothetical protein